MQRMVLALLVVAFASLPALPVHAQIPDHLKCYKVKDALGRATYTADLGASSPLPADSGCVVKTPGKLLCVDTTKTNVNPPPPGAAPGNTAHRFLCYKVKCPKGALPPVPWTDQFGTRMLQPVAPNLLCAPEPAPNPPCVTGGCAACGACGDGVCHLTGGGGGCGTIDNTPQCVSASHCTSSMCNSHNQCGPGQVCVFTGSGTGSLCCDPCP